MTTQIHRRARRRHGSRALALASLAALAIGVAACGSDDEAPATRDTDTTEPVEESTVPDTGVEATDPPDSTGAPATSDEAPATSDPATTEEPATTATTTDATDTTAAPTTTGEPVTVGLDPPCVERDAADPSRAARRDATVEPFGPLGTEASIEIRLPAARSPETPTQESPWAFAEPIDGGLLVTVRSSSFGFFSGSLLAAVDFDGDVRWVRCVPEAIARLDSARGADSALLRTSDERGEGTWQQVELDTGEISPAAILGDDRWSRFPFAVSDTSLLFDVAEGTGTIDPAVDRLLLVDLTTGSETEIEFPESAAGLEMVALTFASTESGDILVEDNTTPSPAVIAILSDGFWTTDSDEIAEIVGTRARFVVPDSGSAPELTGYDASGNVVWSAPDITAFQGEGFTTAMSGDVAVVAGCWEPVAADDECNQNEIGGVDSTTGDVLWQLPGNRGVGPVGDGFALVTDGQEAGQYVMIDTETGEAIEGQVWDDPMLFSTGCCGDEFNWTERHGGVVVATHDRVMSIFQPARLADETVVLTLP